MAGRIIGPEPRVNRLTVDLTDGELAAVLRSGWEHLPEVPEAPLMSTKARVAQAALTALTTGQFDELDD